MKKSIRQMTLLAVTAALLCVVCNDSGTDTQSPRWSGDVDRFLRMGGGGTPDTHGSTYTLATDVSPVGGGSVSRSPNYAKYDSGTVVTVTASPASGYAFAGWEGASTGVTGSVTVTMNGDKALTARFEQKAANTYTLTVKASPAAGGSVSRVPNKAAYTAGESVNVTAAPGEHYEFTGWSGASASTSDAILVDMDGNKELTANFALKRYKLTTSVSVPAGGTVKRDPNEEYFDANERVTVTATASQGYTFNGWSGASTSTSATVIITMDGNKTLTADFGQQGKTRFTVYFNPNGATGSAKETASADSGSSIALPDQQAMQYEGHEFGGWNTKSDGSGSTYGAYSSYAVTRDNVTLFARWIPVYTVTFDATGGTVSPASAATDTTGKLASLPTPAKTGYTFNGWFTAATGGTAVSASKVYTANTIIYAQWTANQVTPSTFTVTWNRDGGSPAPTQTTVTEGGSITAPAAMTRTGYTFGGWYANATLTTAVTFPVTGVTANREYWAKWTPESYTITYTLGSGTVATANPTSYTIESAAITLNNPTRTGYTFAGWTGSNGTTAQTTVTISAGSTGNKSYTATWTEVPANSYTVTWNAAGGSPVPTQTTVTAGGSIAAPATMTKTGYTFGGWYANSGLTTAVTFPVTSVTANREYWAKWTPESYTITYTLGGGTATPANPTSYTIESATITLNNPTRTGYTFAGWTGSNGTTAQTTVTIPTGSTGNKSYTTTWTEVPVIGDGKGTFTDSRGGGTTYKYVTIGGKKWMAENLNYDTANTVGSWCYENSASNCVKYGRLYNWNTAMAGSTSSTANPSGRRGVCPEGWHLPSRAEWGELAKAAGGTGDYGAIGTAGKKLKSTSGWNSNGNGTDSLGFSALPGGYYYGGSFSDVGYGGYWWTATEGDASSGAYDRDMGSHSDYVYEDNYYKSSSLSVRCVGD